MEDGEKYKESEPEAGNNLPICEMEPGTKGATSLKYGETDKEPKPGTLQEYGVTVKEVEPGTGITSTPLEYGARDNGPMMNYGTRVIEHEPGTNVGQYGMKSELDENPKIEEIKGTQSSLVWMGEMLDVGI